MRPNNGAIKIVAGNSNPPLADAIAAYLATPLTKAVASASGGLELPATSLIAPLLGRILSPGRKLLCRAP